MLELEDLRIRQGDFALSADLKVPEGARVAVIGASGSGKSTLLGAIAGFIAPEKGRILWGGEPITPLLPAKRPVSILFQENNLFPHLTAAQNIGLGLRPDLKLSAGERGRVEEAMKRTGLEGLGHRRPADLSGGQQSRVALARALLRNKPLMLLDEPFSALGPALKREMLSLLAEIADETGNTVLMVTHDPDDARMFADLVVLVDEGLAHPPIPTTDIFENPPEALRRYLGAR